MNIFVTFKTKRWFRIILIVSKILVVIGITGYVLYLILTSPNLWDIKTVNDADLQFEKNTPRENENAANFLPVKNKVTEVEKEILANQPRYENGLFYKQTTEYSEKEIMSESELEKYITDSKPLVEKFVSASQKSYYYCPYDVHAYPASETCYIGSIWSSAALVSIHAKYALSIYDINRAQMLVMSLLNIGQMVSEQKSPNSSVEFLAGVGIMANAIEIIESNPNLQRIFKPIIKNYSLPDDVLSRTMIAEYHIFKNAITRRGVMVAEGFGKLTEYRSYFWRPNMTANIYAEYIRATNAAFATPCGTEPDYSKLEAFRKEYDRSLADTDDDLNVNITFLKPNIVGSLILSRASQDLSNFRDEKCDFNARIEKLSNPG